MMEKHGAIDPKDTPPEDAPLDAAAEKRAAAKQALLFELEQDSLKRMADHASKCCGGTCKESKPVVDN